MLQAGASAQHTNVLVVGETIRADYLRECGGWQKVRAVHAGSIVACDVTASANITTASVPLLVSREMPGHGLRVSGDGTFQRAFDASGFATYWLATQDPSVAWPDAAVRRFQSGPDRMMLLPLLDEALQDGRSRRSIVLQGMGAHSPYCARFDRGTAPYADTCDQLGDLPSDTTATRWRAMYANAVDSSIGFLNEVIERLAREKGEAFLVFAADHGENLVDDARRAYGHALRQPTEWELHVPLVFWANAAWKATHRHEWAMLQANAARPLMHADVVPTLIAAAGIRYVDTRRLPANLLAGPVPLRERIVQLDYGTATTWEALLRADGEP